MTDKAVAEINEWHAKMKAKIAKSKPSKRDEIERRYRRMMRKELEKPMRERELEGCA